MQDRALPVVGHSVRVMYLAAIVSGVITSVDEDLRGLEVLTEDEDVIRFQLSKHSGRFMSEGQTGPRLFFDDRTGPAHIQRT